VGVVKLSDELWLGTKDQSNCEIARSLRNIFKYSPISNLTGKALFVRGEIKLYQLQAN